jgi:hypothetical protein
LVASRDPSIQLSELEAFLPVMASFLVVVQIILALPRQTKGRLLLWALFLISLGPYAANTVAIRRAQSLSLHTQEHPVEALVRNAKADFEELLARQSKTYPAAVEEYRRRYGVEPPPGFEAWFEYATENQSPIIDEFDMIYETVSPFWKLSGSEVVQIMRDAHNTPGIDLWLCSFSRVTAETSCSHPARGSDRNVGKMFNMLLGNLTGVLPNAKFLVNHIDEPRVLIPPAADSKTPLTVTSMPGRPTWDVLTKYCAHNAEQSDTSPVDTHGLPLITNTTSSLNLCAHPSYANEHGLFIAPPSFRLIEGLLPVLSTGAPSTMGDILFPAPAYMVEPEFQYNPAHDIPWSQKSNHLYWAGSTTGSAASTDNGWHNSHRQRFIALAQNLPPHHPHTYLHEVPSDTTPATSIIKSIQSTFINTRRYAVNPTRIFRKSTPELLILLPPPPLLSNTHLLHTPHPSRQ